MSDDAAQATSSEDDVRAAALALLSAVERLAGRIRADLRGADGALPDDEYWADTIEEFVDFAEDVLQILDDPVLDPIES